MGMFKDMFKLTRQTQELKRTTPTPSMGEMVKQASAQIEQVKQMQAGAPELLQGGQAGKGIVRAMGTPARGAQWFNLDIDLEVHVGGRKPYRVMNQYMVPASAQLGVGAELPIKVDRSDPAKIAIDWEARGGAPQRGEIRPA
jgi:hypothetical protein